MQGFSARMINHISKPSSASTKLKKCTAMNTEIVLKLKLVDSGSRYHFVKELFGVWKSAKQSGGAKKRGRCEESIAKGCQNNSWFRRDKKNG